MLPVRPRLRFSRRLCVSSHTRLRCYSSIAPARTRFAPSPTGFLHLGSLRTALFNYLLAKNTGGQFLLRIEDTDKKRTVEGAEQSIFDTLRWAGLQWDEGPDVGGPYGPYRQSERVDLHRGHAHRLVSSGHAYRCFCAPERLQALAVTRKRAGLPTDYDRTCQSIPAEESASRAASGEAHVVRLLAPDSYPVFTDAVYGKIKFGENTRAHAMGAFEDPILLKSDGSPTYHLANVVDDHHMKITHVVRATEWLPSTPKHMHLYNCFGWAPPNFVHVGLLEDGKGQKLSKRNGDVFVGEYRDKGYLPEALNNFVALLGWSHKEDSDVLNMEEMVRLFAVNRLTPGNTAVTFGKLEFLQKNHMRLLWEKAGKQDDVAAAERVEKISDSMAELVYKEYGNTLENGNQIKQSYVADVLRANIHNLTLPSNLPSSIPYFFAAPSLNSPPALKLKRQLHSYFSGLGGEGAAVVLADELAALKALAADQWTLDDIHKLLPQPAEEKEERAAYMAKMRALRLALTGGLQGPGVAEVMVLLGRERTLDRITAVGKDLEDGK